MAKHANLDKKCTFLAKNLRNPKKCSIFAGFFRETANAVGKLTIKT